MNRRTKDYGEEKVLVVPKDKIPLWEGIIPPSIEVLDILRKNSSFILRNKAEGNPDLKQIIPYCVLMHTDEAGITRLFYAQRRNNADRELGGKWTIGMGGHINPEDSSFVKLINTKVEVRNLDIHHDFDVTILKCIERELQEEFEMTWQDIINIEYRALIFTSSDGVSKDHIAMVMMVKLATQNVKVKDELFRGSFFTQEEFLIYIGFSEFLNWLHSPEGIEYETQKWKNRREQSTSS